MDIGRYKDLKEAGAVEFTTYGKDSLAFSQKQFDGATGKEVAPRIGVTDRKQIQQQRDQVQEQIAQLTESLENIDELLADIDAMVAAKERS
jgi:predicted site-specific integrase-resolvase